MMHSSMRTTLVQAGLSKEFHDIRRWYYDDMSRVCVLIIIVYLIVQVCHKCSLVMCIDAGMGLGR